MSDAQSSKAIFLKMLLASAIAASGIALAAAPSKPDSAKGKPMNMDEPMAGGMKKEGMKKGDVKKAAEKKDRKMREMLEKEQRSDQVLRQQKSDR